MASIEPYQTKAGQRWKVRYRTPDRKQREKKGFVRKRDAEAYRATIEVSKHRGEYVDPSDAKVTIGELAVAWLAGQTHLKPSSLRPVETSWRVHVEPRWGKVAVGAVSHSAVQAWVAGLSGERGATTVLRAYGVLAGILDVAVKDRRVSVNHARGVNLPRKVSKPHTYLSQQQLAALVRASGERGVLVAVLGYTGLRWGEAIGLRVRDLDMLRRRLSVVENAVEVNGTMEVGTPKTHKRRTLVFPKLLVPALAKACEGKGRDDLVFPGPDGSYMRRTRASKGSKSWFVTALAECGLDPMTPHDLRHTAASLAISSGANVKAVQRMLGHASAAMTLDVYADLFDDDLTALADGIDNAARAADVFDLWGSAAS